MAGTWLMLITANSCRGAEVCARVVARASTCWLGWSEGVMEAKRWVWGLDGGRCVYSRLLSDRSGDSDEAETAPVF